MKKKMTNPLSEAGHEGEPTNVVLKKRLNPDSRLFLMPEVERTLDKFTEGMITQDVPVTQV
jgi:hypothetical protein